MRNYYNLSNGHPFLNKLTKSVLSNLQNEQFGVEDLADLMCLSRSQLHRKLKKLTGKSISQFIREIRLEQAMTMITGDDTTLSEISYRVGFGSPSYFFKCFYIYFGVHAKEVKKQAFNTIMPKKLNDKISKINQKDGYVVLLKNAIQKIHNKSVFLITAILLIIAIASGVHFFYKSPGIDSIAILPFHNITDDPEQDYYAMGLHDALISELGQVSSLRVISRASVLKIDKWHQASLEEIAKKLEVDAVVKGSVTGTGGNFSILLQLIDVFPKEKQIWVKEFPRDLRNDLFLKNDIVKRIANEINITLISKEQSLITNERNANPEAYNAYLKGRFYWDKLSEKDLNTAMKYFKLAKEIDPEYALAYAGISLVYIGQLQQGFVSYNEIEPIISQTIEKALNLDSTLSEVHFIKGVIKCWVEWDFLGSEKELRKAISFNPNNSAARAYISHVLNILNHPKEAMEQIKIAIRLDPINNLYQSLYCMNLNFNNQYSQAINLLNRILIEDPTCYIALSTLRSSYHLNGMYPEALETWISSYKAMNDFEAVEVLNQGQKLGGYRGSLEQLAELLISRSDSVFVTPWQIATIYTRALNKDKALFYLEKAFEAHDNNMPYIKIDPIFNFLRNEERFQKLLMNINLPIGTSTLSSHLKLSI